jgi:uncharacterized protein (TIGR02646 family)
MKRINKDQPPDELRKWRKDNAAVPQNLFYGCGEFPRDKVLGTLLREQGYVCAYTLKRLCSKSAHVEHLKPQATCKNEDDLRESNGKERLREDIAWENMVACFPEPEPPAPPEYGAVLKDRWWHPIDFVSPLNTDCEERFRFSPDGKISAAVDTDTPAQITIRKIGLDNEKLNELRKTVFLRAGIHRRAESAITSVAKVEQLIARWSNRDVSTGAYPEFCVPLVQVAKEYARFLRDMEARK